MLLDDYLAQCMAAWKDSRRDRVIEVLKSTAERVPTVRAYLRFRRSLKDDKRPYVRTLFAHLRRALRELGVGFLDDITTDAVAAWIEKQKRKGASPVSTKNARYALRAFCTWAVKQRLLSADPVQAVKAPKVQHDPDALDPDDIPRVLEASKGHEGEAAVALALLAGLRRSEIERLQWFHIDFRRGAINLSAGITKTGKKRSVPLHPKLIEILSRRQLEAGDLPPAGGHHVDTLSDWAAEILDKAGVRRGGRALQVLRRTWVSVLRFRGVTPENVSAWAGHSIEVQERHYRRAYVPAGSELIERLTAL